MSDNEHFYIEFRASGRGKARCAPDPQYPKGIALDVTIGKQPFCKVELPYPAPECGIFDVRCNKCSFRLVVTAAGRPDDPTEVKIACLIGEN